MMSFEDFARYIGLSPFLQFFKGGARSQNTQTREAVGAYEGLLGDFKTEVNIPIVRDGRLFYGRTSVAKLGLLSATNLETATRDIERILRELQDGGFISFTKPGNSLPFSPSAWPNGVAIPDTTTTHDSRLSDPLRFLETPPRIQGLWITNVKCAYNPGQFPPKWPRPVNIRPVYITPKVITDRTALPDVAIIDVCGRLADAVTRFVRASNVNIRRLPLTLAIGNPAEYFGDTIPPRQGTVGAEVAILRNKWGGDWERYWQRDTDYMIRLPRGMADPASSALEINTSPGVLNGLRQRQKVGVYNSINGDHLNTGVADPIMEFGRLVMVASALVQISGVSDPQGKLVHLHAATLADTTMRGLAYGQLNLPQGSNLFTYLNALDREKVERERRRDNNALAILGLPGTDANGDTVSGGSCGTLQLALAAAPLGPVGVVVAIGSVIVGGIIALVSWLTTDVVVERPDQNVLHDTANNCFPGISAAQGILEGPCVHSQWSEVER